MILYEVTNGYTGMSYVRCYVWAVGEDEATVMVMEKFANVWQWRDFKLTMILNGDDNTPFITNASDSGWETE